MKALFIQYAAYNKWATGLLLHTIDSLTEEQVKQEIKSSFSSLYKTVLHILDAESIWWQRMKLQDRIEVPGENFSGSMKELSAQLVHQNNRWQEWVNAVHEHGLQHEFIYFNSKKERFKQPIYQMLMQVFNHASYHRGQLVTMLRHLGVEKIPQTDFIAWSRKK